MKNVGFSFGVPEKCNAKIELRGDGDEPTEATLFHSAAEVGQGTHTALTQMAADATGLPIEAVDTVWSDTAHTADSGSVSASRMTFMAGNCHPRRGRVGSEGMARWRPAGDRRVSLCAARPPKPLDPDDGRSVPNFSYGYVAEAVDLTVDVETGRISGSIGWCAPWTSARRSIRCWSRAQIEGAVVQAHGYVLSEKFDVAGGRIINPRLSQYLIPGIGDIPDRGRLGDRRIR